MVLTHREYWQPRKSQRELSQDRFTDGGHPGNKPSPGVYARHNAVDTPALLPDGSTSAISIPAPLRARDDARAIDVSDITNVRRLTEGESE
jgi:NADH-quinone oxidoreductase subunit J